MEYLVCSGRQSALQRELPSHEVPFKRMAASTVSPAIMAFTPEFSSIIYTTSVFLGKVRRVSSGRWKLVSSLADPQLISARAPGISPMVSNPVREPSESAPEPAPVREPSEPVQVREPSETAQVREPRESAPEPALVREPREPAPVWGPTEFASAPHAPPWRASALHAPPWRASALHVVPHGPGLPSRPLEHLWATSLLDFLFSVLDWGASGIRSIKGWFCHGLQLIFTGWPPEGNVVFLAHGFCCVCVVPCAFSCLLSVPSHLVTSLLFQLFHHCLHRYPPRLSPYLFSRCLQSSTDPLFYVVCVCNVCLYCSYLPACLPACFPPCGWFLSICEGRLRTS